MCNLLSNIESFDYRTFYDSDGFFCTPSLGQIIEGHNLLFSKNNIINFTQIAPHRLDHLEDLVNNMNRLTSKNYGKPTVFEHGPTECETSVGCGTDIAHLHFVPFDSSLIISALSKKYERYSRYRSIKEFISLNSDICFSYILVGDQDNGYSVFKYGKKKTSQVVRRILFNYSSNLKSWDWRISPTPEITSGVFIKMRESFLNENL